MFFNKLKKRITELENQVWELKNPLPLKIGDKPKAYVVDYSSEAKNHKVIRKGNAIIANRIFKHEQSDWGAVYHYAHYHVIFNGQLCVASHHNDGLMIDCLV